MSILFVLLTFLLIITVTYFRRPTTEAVQVQPELPGRRTSPLMTKSAGSEIPTGYEFHPGHTWVCDEGRQNARVGIDAFAAQLFGKIDRIETVELNRWVRQGQKLWTVTSEGRSIEMLSPIEGVVVSLNHNIIKNPDLLATDPYKEGWICVVKSPDLATNMKNLIQGPLVAPWMQNTLNRLNSLATQFSPAMAQDGGVPVKGLLTQMDPATQERIVKEFFLT
ncbi:MAG TPA: glycine cleavage system protein H [Candidatus Koribacter sp.]|jgi:glycine cleavage system H lipoate-binding protein